MMTVDPGWKQRTWSDSKRNLKVDGTGFPGDHAWSVKYSEELRIIPSFLAWADGKVELPSTEKKKSIGRGSFREKTKSLV